MQDANNRGSCIWGGVSLWNSMYHLLSYFETLKLYQKIKSINLKKQNQKRPPEVQVLYA